MGYDIIGDIHGCSETLIKLLDTLEYSQIDGVYQHESRKVIFLGDFIDRGLYQREVLSVVRPMIDGGHALAVMGNHEFNAIAYHTQHNGEYLRPHNEKNKKQHKAFLDSFEVDDIAYAETIEWFKTLPLWLDLDELKVIHACWDKPIIDRVCEAYGSASLSDELLLQASTTGTWQYEAIETLLKGKEIPIPEGAAFKDKDGNVRHEMRVRWWDRGATTYREAFMGPEYARVNIPDDEIGGDFLVDYAHDAPPVFLGHYWLQGEPEPLALNIACVDYSVAKPGGKLVAYRWDGEAELSKDKFTCVNRLEP